MRMTEVNSTIVREGSSVPSKDHPALHTGDPKSLPGLQHELRQLLETQSLTSQEGEDPNKRPDWGAETAPGFDSLSRRLNQIGVFNTDRDSTGKIIGHYDLQKDKELRGLLRGKLKELADSNLIRIIMPFVNESSAAHDIQYNKKLVGPENIVAIESGPSPDRKDVRKWIIESVQKTGVDVLNQWEILAKIPWKKMREADLLPIEGDPARPPKGTKGRQLYAGAMWLYAKEAIAKSIREGGGTPNRDYNPRDILDDNATIFFHDADIADPNLYSATELLAIPLLSQYADEFLGGQIALLGPGRNNQSLRGLSNDLMNNALAPEWQKLGEALNRIIWHLTGERWLRWGELKKSMFATGMCIETVFNFHLASRTILEEREVRAQVAPAKRKEEIGQKSTLPREFRMLYTIEDYYVKLALFSGDIQKLPSNWSLADIGEFNRRYTGKLVYHALESESSEGYPTFVSTLAGRVTRPDELLPPIEGLHKQGIITIADLREISRVPPLEKL